MLVWCIVSAAAGALVSGAAVSILSRRRVEKNTDRLIEYLTALQDNLRLPAPESCCEGNFGILESEIYKVVALIRESCSRETSQKKYMADMFLDISHQLKTPLTAVSIMTELLENPSVTAEQREEYLSKINTQINRINWLVKNILVLSQLEASVLELKKETVRLSDMTEHIRETFEIMAEVKNVSLLTDCPDDIFLTCDRHWTNEAVSNIVKNSIEHTGEGGKTEIRVSQNVISTSIVISDNGEGIGAEHIPHIFERSYKVKPSSDSAGIGLALSRQIIVQQQGTVSVKSEPGKGTEFEVKFFH